MSSRREPQGWRVLALGALGVVFGDIGTSPLYSLQTVFSIDHNSVDVTPGDVYGVISLVFWSITLIVSVKYVVFILAADNDGEGGIMALAALVMGRVTGSGRRYSLALVLGIVGASLFFGDSVITPAISVMSAIEGLSVPAPHLAHWVVPIGAVVILGLFCVQRFGTHRVGRFFGPLMVVWFLTIAALGAAQVARDPGILRALSPTYAVLFVLDRPGVAFIAMGAVVLSITGAEALYADMGHFGRPPIRRAWFGLVFPALTLNYLGQGSLIVERPAAAGNPFFVLAPTWFQVPLVVLATVATVIASQSVISGAYSVARQAVRLGFLPRLTVRQTSPSESGQIYVPVVNWLLFGGVMVLLLTFRSSARLATAYGLAVTGTFVLTTALFLVLVRASWGWSWWRTALVGTPLVALELTYFVANLTKVLTGGWLPLVIAAVIATVMLTWRKGAVGVTARRTELERPIEQFLAEVHSRRLRVVPGTAIFLHPVKGTTPIALLENIRLNHVVHERMLVVSTVAERVPHVPADERFEVEQIEHAGESLTHVTLRFGFMDEQDVPDALRRASRNGGLVLDPDDAYYVLSRITLASANTRVIRTWRMRLFVAMAHNAASPTGYFRLPEERTIILGTQLTV